MNFVVAQDVICFRVLRAAPELATRFRFLKNVAERFPPRFLFIFLSCENFEAKVSKINCWNPPANSPKMTRDKALYVAPGFSILYDIGTHRQHDAIGLHPLHQEHHKTQSPFPLYCTCLKKTTHA